MKIRFKTHEIVFVLFLVFAMVRELPFSPRTLDTIDSADDASSLVKQALHFGFFVAMAAVAYRQAWGFLRNLPTAFLLLIAYSGVSIAWSVVPLIAATRWASIVIIALTVLLGTARLRPRTALDIVRWVALALTLASLIAGILYPAGAIHQPGDPESAIVGGWRGVFTHKNSAGAVVGLALVLSVDALARSRRLMRDGATIILAAGVLYLTGSRTSEVAALGAIVTLFAFRGAALISARSPVRALLLRLTVMSAGVVVVALVWFQVDFQSFVLDPEAFTGRGYVWGVIVQMIELRPWFGVGIGSVFQAGENSVLFQLTPLDWIHRLTQSHNGALDLLASLGVVGFVLYVWAMIVDPWRRLSRMPAILRDEWQPVIAALLAYVLIRSLTESGILSSYTVDWPILVLIIGLLTRISVVIGNGFGAAPGAAGGFRESLRSDA